MHSVAVSLSGLSLVAVIVIGWKTLQYGRRSTEASECAATASVQAVLATERSVLASEQAARLAEQDALVRRIDPVLDVVLEMRQLFNDQVVISELNPRNGSPEALARLALCRRLEVRLVPFKDKIEPGSDLYVLANGINWFSDTLERAITDLKSWISNAISSE
jgi:hypothetical protein